MPLALHAKPIDWLERHGGRVETSVIGSVQYREPVEQSVCAVEGEHDGARAVLDSAPPLRVGEDALLNSVSYS